MRYTDKVLADIIDTLKGASGMNTAMLYVSDHGESLGENGLYLHGAPYWMSPDEQVQVPMVMWMSDNFAQDYKVDREKPCRDGKEQGYARKPLSHRARPASGFEHNQG